MTVRSSPAPQPHAPLSRTIGRWSLAALMVNSIIGSGIFGLPSIIARQVGTSAVFAWLAAALFNAVIIGCFAELASRFAEPGGPYLYARAAFGPLIGIWTGWLAWAVRLASAAAAANLFVIYLGELWPGAQELAARVAVLTLLVGFVAVINYRGVRGGTQLSNFFTVAKLLPLLVGLGNAKRLALLGAKVDAQEAYRLGLAVELAPAGAHEAAALRLAAEVLQGAPLAVAAQKRLLDGGTEMSLAAAEDAEVASSLRLTYTEDHQEAKRAFAEKRAPRFRGL
jgi:L-asparagine transporter-like permease